MKQFLGDDSEEKRRKDELRSILSASAYGLLFGGLGGGALAGYRGFLLGMFIGMVGLSLFAILGIRAERMQRDRQSRQQNAAASTGAGTNSPRRPVRRR
jgi:predicted lipid-binding transport protein (Tim44 family)